MRSIGVWSLVLLSVQLLAARHASCAFLQNQLPLQVVLTTPSEILSNATNGFKVDENQAFQVVFSRPVIALGSDFGLAEPPQSLVPFTVNCSVPGLFRWVTTNIARWDPTIQWPTDLDCNFVWNTGLKSFDGAPLVLTGPKTVPIRSAPIQMEIPDGGITSEYADNVTDNQWNAYRGMKDDHFPEVPPDANITLTFTYPVYLPALQQALQVVSCCGSNAGAGQKLKVLPCEPPYVVVDPFATPEQQAQQRLNSTCAIVKLDPGLPPSGVAVLRLPKGVRYNLVSGPTTNNTDIFLWGLRRFRIPLRDNFQQLANASQQFDYQDNGISYRRMTLWLPHGLAKGVTAEQIKQRIWFCRYQDPYNWASKCVEAPFNLTLVNKGQMLMTVPDLWVRQHYQIKVYSSGDIKDAYGLPLEESETYFFTTEPNQDLSYPELASGSQVMLLEPSAGDKPLDWPVVYRGLPRSESDAEGVSVWPVDISKVVDALAVLGGRDKPDMVKSLLGKPAISWARPRSSLTATKSLTLSGKPGLNIVASPTNGTYDSLVNTVMVVQSDLQYAAVSLGTKITHFITLTQGQTTPVPRAKVSLFLFPYDAKPITGPACTTDTNGTCTVDVKPLISGGNYGQLAAVVEAADHGPLVVYSLPTPSSYEDESLSYSYVGDLVVDRVIVMPGDKLHVTGFVQERTFPSNRLVLPTSLKNVNVTVQPGFKPGSSEPLVLSAQLNATYGSFHVIIPVPSGTKAGEYSLNLVTPKFKNPKPDDTGDNSAEVATVSITIGTPRPSTAVLNVTVPDWAPPNSTVKLLIQASSYLGADVSGAVIDLSWTLPKASGKLNVTTDAKGKAEAFIPLGKLPPKNASVLGDTLSISAVWIGPTRERITQDIKVIIANGPVRAEVTRSPSTDVPGVPFIMTAQTTLNNKDSTEVEGVAVDVYLKPNQTNSLENCTAAQQEQVSSQRCRIISGIAADKPCTLTIPCAANLKLVACPVSFANGTHIRGLNGQPGCSETPVGRNTSDWQMNPWSIAPDLGLLKDRQNYTVGSTAVLSWVNAYWRPATGLLVWGNSRLMKQKVLATIPTGPSSITLTLGDECLGGCQAYVVLSLPRPADNAAGRVKATITPITDLQLPVSKLFDPLMPATESASVTLHVLEDNRLNVSVTITPSGDAAEGGGGALPASLFKRSAVGPNGKITPIMKPGGNATIQVTVTDFYTGELAPEAEVTIVVADQAILDLLPYPLPDVAADMVSMPSIQSFIKEINDYRTTRQNINITYATLERRLKLDPWLPLVTTVSPSTSTNYQGWGQRVSYPVASVADASDQDYLKGFTSPLTQTPFYTWGLAQRYPAGSSGKGEAGAALRLSSEFQTTPLFTVIKTTADGSATVRFKAPPNLSTFTVRAYAVSKGSPGKSSKYGGNETQVIVRQPLSLTPSVPKSVRVDDDFEAGVLVSAPDAAAPILVEITSTVVGANQTSEEMSTTSAAGTKTNTSTAATNSTATLKPTKTLGRTVPSTTTEAAASAPNSRGLLEASEPSDGSLVLLPQDPMTTSITITPQLQQIEVRFRYKAKAIGTSGLRFVARVQTQQQPAALNMESAKVSSSESQVPAAGAKPLRLNLLGTEVIAGSPATTATLSQAANALLAQQAGSSRSLLALTAAAQLANEGSNGGWVVADAVQEDVQVQGQQTPVFVATSFSLQAQGNVTGSKGRQEGLVLPDAAPGSGSISLLAGVGYLPAVKVSYTSLLQQQQRQAETYDNPESFVPYGPDALNTALLPAFLARYTPAATQPAAAATNRTNGTIATAGPKALLSAQQLNASSAAAKAVTSSKLTTADSGLMYSTISNYSTYTPTPSVTLNAWAVWLTQQAIGDATTAAKNTMDSLPYSRQIRNATSIWKAIVASQLVKNAEGDRNPPKSNFKPVTEPLKMYMDFNELSWARLALGPDWLPPKGTAQGVAGDLRLPRQVLAATTPKNMSTGGQARTGMTLMEVIAANGKSTSGVTLSEAKAAVDKLTKAILSNVRVSGRTAYIADPPGSASAAGTEEQALALQFLTQQDIPAVKEILPKLAAYVAGGQANIGAGAAAATCVSVGGTTAGTVASALSMYDASRGSTNPNAALTVTAVSANATNTTGGAASNSKVLLLNAKFTPDTAGGIFNTSTDWSKLPPEPKLTFDIEGTAGEVSVAAGLDFTPAKLLPFPSYRGLWVERVIQTEQGQGNLLAADLADVVTVTVQLTSPDDLSGVVLEVLMPGGLEPVDPNVYKDAAAQAQCDFGGGYYSSWWCPQQSTLRSVVTFTFGYLGAGTVNIKFKAIAATPGEFVLPPVKAYTVQQPEVMGLSAAGNFTICPNRRGANAAASTASVAKTPGAASFFVCEPGQVMAQPVAPAKSCPGNCNSNGVCNINTGVCLCNSGFSGNACQVYKAS